MREPCERSPTSYCYVPQHRRQPADQRGDVPGERAGQPVAAHMRRRRGSPGLTTLPLLSLPVHRLDRDGARPRRAQDGRTPASIRTAARRCRARLRVWASGRAADACTGGRSRATGRRRSAYRTGAGRVRPSARNAPAARGSPRLPAGGVPGPGPSTSGAPGRSRACPRRWRRSSRRAAPSRRQWTRPTGCSRPPPARTRGAVVGLGGETVGEGRRFEPIVTTAPRWRGQRSRRGSRGCAGSGDPSCEPVPPHRAP